MKKLILSAMAFALSASAVMAQSEEIKTKYNEAATAFGAKDYATAAAAFTSVIDDGMDDEGSESLVATAKANLPACYYQLGLADAKTKNFDGAIENLTKSANFAELYDAVPDIAKAKSLAGKIYQAQGGSAFNDKDYATATPIFEKGVEMDPRNTKMANWLGICYCETGDLQKGMEVFAGIMEMGATNPKYAADAETASANMNLYINNKVAELQGNKDYDGVITMADEMLTSNPSNATAAKVRLQAYMDKKDYNKVIELGAAAAEIQTSDEESSNVHFIVGAAYNAKEMKPQAIASLQKVTAGDNVATAKSIIAELSSAE
ncbi:MAG: tetratricopeptide repeat protein [Rikenellaceae bacterium]